MWFLIKSTVFLMLTLVVLSFFSTDDSGNNRLSATTMTDAVLSAGEIVHYMSGICVEKPEVCIKGAQTIALLGERTREGAKVAYQLMEGQFAASDEANAPAATTRLTSAATEAATTIATDKINTGTVLNQASSASAEPALTTLRIPVPLRRPQVH